MFSIPSATPAARCSSPRPLAWALALALVASSLPAATITVNTDSDDDIDDAQCSLREAITAANLDFAYHGCGAGSGIDYVLFALPAGSTILGSVFGLPTIIGSLVLAGPGAGALTIDGAGLQPLFLVDSPAGGIAFQVQDLTLANGNAFSLAFSRGGAVTLRDGDAGVFRRVVFRDNYSELGGGALLLTGAVGVPAIATVEDCYFESNEAGIAGGGAILIDKSTLDVSRSTFAFNETDAEPAAGEAWGGGGVSARDSTLTIRTSTFSGNSTFGSGGAILVFSKEPELPDSFTLTDSTIWDNVGDGDGDDLGNVGGVALAAVPGHLFTAVLQNNLIARNVDGGATVLPDIYASGVGLTTNGFNLIGKNPSMTTWFPTGAPNANGDYVGTLASPVTASLTQLDYYGGLYTPIHLPQPTPGNLAIDRGNCFVDGYDQRGFGNPATHLRAVDNPLFPNAPGGDACDIGAAEAGAVEFLDLPFADGFEDGTTGHWSSTIAN